jgi:non-specific riboncleoside hydrolase
MSDYGLDDAVATAWLLDNNKWDSIDIVAIAGNTTADNSLNNAHKLLHQRGKLHNVTLVDTVDQIQNYAHLPSIHGVDGMGDLYKDATRYANTVKFDTWLSNLDKNQTIDIASLGPATLVVPLLKHLDCKCNDLLMMGHNIRHQPNYQGEEFNFALDIENFVWCLKHTDCKVATLDTCRDATFNLSGRRVSDNSMFGQLLNKSIELAELRHQDNAYVYDYIAVRYLVNNEFDIVQDVDTRGNKLNHLKVNCRVDLLK